MPGELTLDELKEIFITPDRCYRRQKEILDRDVGIKADIEVLKQGQEDIKSDVKEIKDVVLEIKIKRRMVSRFLGTIVHLPKTTKIILLILAALGILASAGASVAWG